MTYCMGCMQPLGDNETHCHLCGYPAARQNPSPFLPARTTLSERYLVGRVLGETGASAEYLGLDVASKEAVVVTEFLPRGLCGREEETGALRVLPGCAESFGRLYAQFGQLARKLAHSRDLAGICPTFDIFETNGTVYAVSEYSPGGTLEEYLAKTGGTLTWDEARPLFMPLLSTLGALHRLGVWHLGLSPHTIYMNQDGKLCLRHFTLPEARQEGRDVPATLEAGYSAPEQYEPMAELTGAIDVYGMGAVIFRVLTGAPPVEAPGRAKNNGDLLVPAAVARELPKNVSSTLFRALQLNVSKRVGGMAELGELLGAEPVIGQMAQEQPVGWTQEVAARKKRERRQGRSKTPIFVLVNALALLLVAAVVTAFILNPAVFGYQPPADTTSTTATTLDTSPQTTAPTTPTGGGVPVPSLIGSLIGDYQSTEVGSGIRVFVAGLQYDDARPRGVILSQDPAPGADGTQNQVINVIISAGPASFAMPNVSGWRPDQATALLEALGFLVTQAPTPVYTSDPTMDGLVASTSITAGTMVSIGAKVTITLYQYQG